ncbi:MAG: hypothetical protein MUE71_08800, partial [Chitinophagaceae bacterium]|nr:hypothetical protein [Chitinophagaceae bacterium]
GDRVKALFKAPFNGRMLVTVEGGEVLSHHWLEVKKRTATMDIELDEKHLPNAYITATLFKPHTMATDLPLTAAHGLANIQVKDESKRLPVSI